MFNKIITGLKKPVQLSVIEVSFFHLSFAMVWFELATRQ